MTRRILPLILILALILCLCPTALADSADCGAKLLAITFDDGPGPYTGTLLDGLAERSVKATFFTAGYRAAEYPETLKRIVAEGHQLANHTYNHKDLSTLSAEGVRWEIDSTQAYITAAGGSESAYIRPPYGSTGSVLRAEAGAPLIIWSVDPLDWKNFNSDTVCRNIVRGCYDGAIILVHDIHRTSVYGALAAIDELTAAGYEFVTVEELLLRRGVTPEAGRLYYDAKNNGVNLTAEQISPEYYDEALLEQHWGYAALSAAMEAGWLAPDEEGRWLPEHRMTRGEFVSALCRFCGGSAEPGAQIFEDVSVFREDAAAIRWACEQELMVGEGALFRPDDRLNREQMAAVMARYLRSVGYEAEAFDPAQYADWEAISGWALEDVCFCSALGILSGDGKNFRPGDPLTRAQTASMLQRLDALRTAAPKQQPKQPSIEPVIPWL